jgi:hypothetical protein
MLFQRVVGKKNQRIKLSSAQDVKEKEQKQEKKEEGGLLLLLEEKN